MKQVIKVTEKAVYGRILVYPSCETAKKFAALLNVKTFSHSNLCGIEALGYNIETTKVPA
jgi:hypothetical protein